jgi:ribosome-associated heat shock protein Hsp15
VTADIASDRTKGRLDQWLWFARLVKSRSGAARLCAAGLVAVNGVPVRKPSHTVRVGDTIVLPQGRMQRTARILAVGHRRGPAVEARLLYEEIAAATPLSALAPQWLPLLDEALDHAPEHDLPGPMSR